MKEDIHKIKRCDKVIVPADKTANLYCMDVQQYKGELRNNITKDYKLARTDVLKSINSEAAAIASRMDLSDRVEAIAEKPANITVKDHKPDFPARLHCRLINPCKNNLGVVAKSIVDKINDCVRAKSGLHQWRSTEDALYWFTHLNEHKSRNFLKFDIDAFYPSITKDLLYRAIVFCKEFIDIPVEDIRILMHVRKMVLVDNDGRVWEKRNESDFDVTIGSFDGVLRGGFPQQKKNGFFC